MATALAVALAAIPSPHAAGDASGAANLTYGRTAADAADASSYLEQNYSLGFRQQSFEYLSYQAEVGFLDTWSGPASGPSSRAQQLVPRLGVNATGSRWSARAGYDGALRAEHSLSSGVDAWTQRASAEAVASPLPWIDLSVSGMRTMLRDAARTTDVTDDSLTMGVALKGSKLKLRQSNTLQRATQGVGGRFTRTQLGTATTVGYDDRLPAGVALRTQYRLEYNRAVEETFEGTVEAPRSLRPVEGLYAFDDDDPLDGTLAPLDALVDGERGVSTGIALGEVDGSPNHNIGVDMGSVVVLDELQIFVRDAQGRPLSVGGLVDWNLYVSLDGTTWRGVTAGESFSAAGSFYSLTFDATEARFFKAENIGRTVLPSYVTEVEVFVHETIDAVDSQSRRFLTHSGEVALSAAPRPGIALSYRSRANVLDVRQASGGGRSWDWTNGVGASFALRPDLRAETGYDIVRSSSSASDRTIQQARAALSYTPFRELSTGVRVFAAQEAQSGFWSRTIGAGASVRMLPYPFLRFHTGGDFARQTRSEAAGAAGYLTLVAGAGVQVTRSLQLSAAANGRWGISGDPQQADTSSPLPLTLLYQRYSMEGQYRLSSQFSLGARVGYSAATTQGWIQSYRLAWSPLAGGVVTVSTGFDNDIDLVADRRSRRAYGMLGWRVNRRTTLDVAYSTQSLRRDLPTGSVDSSQQQIFSTLAVAL